MDESGDIMDGRVYCEVKSATKSFQLWKHHLNVPLYQLSRNNRWCQIVLNEKKFES
jgi:hypothetical protein